ncbi:MAG: enolase superfamily enzyme related to L-alanine-DL-glutamate epimerase [Chthoniobacteraceae bacterium]|nr:enolase superfamily enzyme related to L-alanine-DL-glutamate epimerase [Chthoniobacteraceae bacterium]
MKLIATRLYYLPIQTRLPLKFGNEVLTEVTCARVSVEVHDSSGRRSVGWGETPLSVQWIWPSSIPYSQRLEKIERFCALLAKAIVRFELSGHPIMISHAFQETVLPGLLFDFNQSHPEAEPMPWLAALVCFSAFDLALHDAYGLLLKRPSFETYGSEHLPHDLAGLLENDPQFSGKYPADFLCTRREQLCAWHLVGGLDPLENDETWRAQWPGDSHPVFLEDWIKADGLTCLKIKLCGTDSEWDYKRLCQVGSIGLNNDVQWLSADFNCTVHDPAYVSEILARLYIEHPMIEAMTLYVEQPFPYELQEHKIDVHTLAEQKPLFLDESAHDWRMVRLGRELGWNGVALKTCKTLTGALLSACWAQAHGLSLMVQDLTNPMLAQISHVQLAAYLPTLMGVETNSMQFYPDASNPEAMIHPGLYRRRDGRIDLSSVQGPGLGYRIEEIMRELPEAIAGFDR